MYIILSVLAALILAVVILLHIPIKAYVSYIGDKFSLYVKYMRFTVYTLDGDKTDKPKNFDKDNNEPTRDADVTLLEIPDAEKQPDKHNEVKKPSEPAEKASPKKPRERGGAEKENKPGRDKPSLSERKRSLLERWNQIKVYIPTAKKALKRLLKMIKLSDLYVKISVGDDDPYEAGMKFAKTNQAFYPALALLCCLFSVKIKHTEINCDYEKNASGFDGSVTVSVTPAAILSLALFILINYLKIKRSEKKRKPSAESEKKEG